MADYNIRLGTIVDTSNIQAQINKVKKPIVTVDARLNMGSIQRQINRDVRANPILIDVRLNATNVQQQIDNIRQQILSLNDIAINLGAVGGGNGGRTGRGQINETTQAYRELLGVLGELNSKRLAINGLNASSPQSSEQIQTLRLQIEQLENEYNNLMNAFNAQGIRFTAEQWNNLETILARVGRQIDVVQARMSDKTTTSQQTQAYRELLSVSKEMQSLEINIAKLRGQGGNTNQIEVLENQLRTLQVTYQQLVTSMQTPLTADQWSAIYTQIAQTSEKLAQLQAQFADTRAETAKGITANFGNYDAQLLSLENRFNLLANKPREVSTAIEAVRQALAALKNADGTEDLIAKNDAYKESLRMVEAELKKLELAEKGYNNKAQLDIAKESAIRRLNSLFGDGSAAAKKYGGEVERLRTAINNCGNIQGVRNINKQITALGTEIKNTHIQTQKFGERLKTQFAKYSTYFSVASVIMYSVRALRSMFEQVKAIDSAMTELKKVTNETDASYNQFLRNAASRAKEIGTTIDGLVSSTADFARLGYNFKDAQGLAEVANIYAVVGDEVEGVEGATESLISTMAAFKDEMNGMSNSDFAMSIIDKFNEIGNNFAISSGGIGEALERSASSLMAANNTLDESIALITAANTVVQNPDQVGRLMPTIKMAISVKLLRRIRPRKDFISIFSAYQLGRVCVFLCDFKRG